MSEKTQIEFTVYKRNLPRLQHELDRLNKRAARLGVAPITFEIVRDAEAVTRRNDITGVVIATHPRVVIRVEGETPKLNGWTLAATIAHTEEGNIMRTVPGVEVSLGEYRDAPCKCDHCNLPRVRRDSHLVLHDSGALKQVGSSCIADFLGHADPKALAAQAELLMSAGELAAGADDFDFMGGGRAGEERVYVETMLAIAARVVRRDGYRSRKAAAAAELAGGYMATTRDEVEFTIFPPRLLKDREKARLADNVPTDDDRAYGLAARDYVLSFEERDNRSDFEHNLLVIAKSENIEVRAIGIGVYIVEAYRRHLEGEVKRKAELASRPNVHFGEVGKRYKGRVVRWHGCKTSFETQYGTTYIYLFDDLETGACMKWLSSVEIDQAATAELSVDFTVKKHDTWKSQLQTNVSRVKILF